MAALLVEAYRDDPQEAVLALRVARVPRPVPGPGQVLVRVEAAPCNVSDLLFLQGRYSPKPLPAVPGWEGAGTVVECGEGLLARSLRGRRVAVAGRGSEGGTWAEFVAAPARNCVPLGRLDAARGATLIINPLTAIGLLDVARRAGHRAGVHTAAASQAGRMLVRLAARRGFPLIGVVRGPAQVALLHELGVERALDSTAPGFRESLGRQSAEIGATVAFDAVAGAMTGTLLAALPRASSVIVYGALSGDTCDGIRPLDLVFGDKRVLSFYLGTWLETRRRWRLAPLLAQARSLVADGTLDTHFRRRVDLAGASAALLEYVRDMTGGKVLLLPAGGESGPSRSSGAVDRQEPAR